MTRASRRLAVIALLVLAAPLAPHAQAATMIHAGALIDGISDEARHEVTILVVDGRIAEVREGYSAPGDGDEVIDLKDATVMPGLMDMHVHLTGEMSPKNYLERVQFNTASFAVRSGEYARRTLMAGFTTVRNPGDDGSITVALRREIERGLVPGPVTRLRP